MSPQVPINMEPRVSMKSREKTCEHNHQIFSFVYIFVKQRKMVFYSLTIVYKSLYFSSNQVDGTNIIHFFTKQKPINNSEINPIFTMFISEKKCSKVT